MEHDKDIAIAMRIRLLPNDDTEMNHIKADDILCDVLYLEKRQDHE